MDPLYKIFDNPIVQQVLSQLPLPNYLDDNLRFSVRPYQEEAFRRFVYIDTKSFTGMPPPPLHLLYNMATGSGKTLVMAGLILYLYQKGYRNFLFFVNSTNIINKTRENFLNAQAAKYLFNNKLVLDGNEVQIKEVANFAEADARNINIKFTTIQKLHMDLLNTKENSVTFEDFENKKIILIADEAHHLNAATKSKQMQARLFDSWENTVLRILHSSPSNMLLEFTATLEPGSKEVAEKYQNKVIYKYDLSQYRADKYSKEINLLRSAYNEEQRILQALILNLYRQTLAIKNRVNLKPVILFKAKRFIQESQQNKANFHILIDSLTADQVDGIESTSTIPVIQKAFKFFKKNKISNADIVDRLRFNFREVNCLSANDEKEKEKNQILLNTLEDEGNPIRAIFAVQKLNEGWDALNLFDIVRLYSGRDSTNNAPGKTTLSEAQLIGRGARYYPFRLQAGQDAYTRKFDDDASNDLRVLEELYYHAQEDSRYISELKRALVQSGIYDDESKLALKSLTLKPGFKQSEFYKTGRVIFNNRIPKDFGKVKSLADLGVTNANYKHVLSSGVGEVSAAFSAAADAAEKAGAGAALRQKDVRVKDIPSMIVRFALSKNPFYYFSQLMRYFPRVNSTSAFMRDYLGGLEITFTGTQMQLANITRRDYLQAMDGLLTQIEQEIKANLTDYQGSDYVDELIRNVFKNKNIEVPQDSERADGQEAVVGQASWYAYNANYGTLAEKHFVALFARRLPGIQKKYTDIYLIRNEREVKIYDQGGRAFEPDFLLFCKEKSGRGLVYQVFIEPKGAHLLRFDQWKENFLKHIAAQKRVIKINTDKYLITAVPFYNAVTENAFKEQLEELLHIKED